MNINWSEYFRKGKVNTLDDLMCLGFYWGHARISSLDDIIAESIYMVWNWGIWIDNIKELEERMPTPPHLLFGANQETIETEKLKVRSVKSKRIKNGWG